MHLQEKYPQGFIKERHIKVSVRNTQNAKISVSRVCNIEMQILTKIISISIFILRHCLTSMISWRFQHPVRLLRIVKIIGNVRLRDYEIFDIEINNNYRSFDLSVKNPLTSAPIRALYRTARPRILFAYH